MDMISVDSAPRTAAAVSVSTAPAVGRLTSLNWQRILVVASVIVGVVPPMLGPFNHDVAWYLYGSRRFMQGAKLYVDILDLNPPLVFLLGAPVEWLAMRTGLPELVVMALAVGVMTLVCAHLAASAFRASGTGLDAVAQATIATWLFSVLVLPDYDFGQREHWLVILFFPYCAACLAAAESDTRLPARLAWPIGVLAGLGVSLKPHFLAAVAVTACCVLLRQRRLRTLLTTENVALTGVVAIYGVFVLLVTPEYVWSMVPLASAQYWAFGVDRVALLWTQDVLLIFSGAAVVACGGVMLTGLRRAGLLTQQLAFVCIAFLAAFVIQGKGWFYHLYPAKAFGVIASFATIVAFLIATRKQPARSTVARLAFGARAVLVGGAAIPAIFWVILGTDYHVGAIPGEFSRPQPLLEAVRATAAGKPIYFLSSSVGPAFPIVNISRAEWPYHFHHFWPLPAFYHGDRPVEAVYRPPEAQSLEERRFFETVVEDVIRTPPALLIVDTSTYKQAFGFTQFDYLRYFSQDRRFRELMQTYRPVTRIGYYDVYERVPR